MCLKTAIKTGRRFAPSIAFVPLLLFLAACGQQPARQQITFTGALRAGERFQHPFGGRFTFALVPDDFGWVIIVYEQGRIEDLARLTLPFHGPNPTQIAGWHFRNEDNTGPNDGTLNQPQEVREFIFSPEVGRSIDAPPTPWLRRLHFRPGSLTMEDIDRVASFGRGALHIEQLNLSPVKRGDRARILEMKFSCIISWSNP